MQTTAINQMVIGQTHDLSDRIRYPAYHLYIASPGCINVYSRSKILPGDILIINGTKCLVRSIESMGKCKKSVKPYHVPANYLYHDLIKFTEISQIWPEEK